RSARPCCWRCAWTLLRVCRDYLNTGSPAFAHGGQRRVVEKAVAGEDRAAVADVYAPGGAELDPRGPDRAEPGSTGAAGHPPGARQAARVRQRPPGAHVAARRVRRVADPRERPAAGDHVATADLPDGPIDGAQSL